MFKTIKKLIVISLILTAVFAVANFVLAGGLDINDVTGGVDIGATSGLSDTDPREMAANIIRIVLAFLGILAVTIIMYGGFLWMTAAGDDQKIDTAKKLLINAVIGLIIILSAFAIASFILSRILAATNSTGGDDTTNVIIPPTPIVNCDGNTLTPVCDASDSLCNAGYSCSTASCTCVPSGIVGDSCDADDLTPVCEDDGTCAPGLFCDNSSSCTCQTGSGLYEACNATTTPNVCIENQVRCNFDLTCDTDCFCKDFPIIKELSPAGGFCDDEPDKACSNDNDCKLAPDSTCNSSTPNTAPGNIISILGNYFGTTPGTVLFWDGNNFTIPGLSPSTLNVNCDSNWGDEQIIVIVPNGVVDGPVLIRRADSEEDTTDNDQGPLVEDLIINTITKPGLCNMNPVEGVLGDVINYDGINFTPVGGDIRFGSYRSYVGGNGISFLNDTDASAIVPNIKSGRTTSFVVDNQGGTSNYLRFDKTAERSSDTFIASFDPKAGASLQYVTIYGSGFGKGQGDSRVYFGDNSTGIEAGYDFPDVCLDSIWGDNQVIVKVPDNGFISDGNYIITMVINDEVINTSGLSPNTFNVDNNALLAPSLCKISPIMGQAGNPVSFWGEHFDNFNDDSIVRFYLDREMQIADIISWDIDPEDESGLEVYRVDTIVHDETVTGPVRIIKSDPEVIGNGLNFEVGDCLEATSPNDACGAGNVCCPADTFKAGRCDTNINTCNDTGIPTSVYEWTFSTSPSTIIPDTPFTSCAEKSEILGMCDVDICPNSPGSCSFYDSSFTVSKEVVGDCSYSCQIDGCLSGNCSYDAILDRCLDNNQSSCSLSAEVAGVDKDSFCESYEGVGRRVLYINSNLSCPDNWDRILQTDDNNVSVCVDKASTCALCQDSFVCIDDGNSDPIGVCSASIDICPGDSICESDDRCRIVQSDICECCCRIDFEDQDCCSDLTCGGECGSDKNVDMDTYGICSGCRIEDASGVVDQVASDIACNCEKTSGKYCDVDADVNGDGIPEGACSDCAQLANDDSCSDHSATCCVDAGYDNRCRGGEGNFSIITADNVGYCEYFDCGDNNTTCNASPVAISSTTSKSFNNLLDCQTQCKPAPILGVSCEGIVENTCAVDSCAAPFGCIDEYGNPPVAPSSCGSCCCDPLNDQCASLNLESPGLDLVCQPDKGPCDGDGRGLCCGCSENTDCGDNAVSSGCGSDTCCRARPGVDSIIPADEAVNICSNAEIRVDFNQKMNTDSFFGNVIIVGQYVDVCPEGTDYLALKGEGFEDKNILIRTYYKLANKIRRPIMRLLGRDALASPHPIGSMNYCAVRGTVSSQQNGDDGTTLRFAPVGLLDTAITYFVIIKGDAALNNDSGVLDFWDVGMNIGDVEGPVDNTYPFNGIVYENSYIWSFTTLASQEDNPTGICKVNSVEIEPSSYLFNSAINDLNENDAVSSHETFDTEADKDKKFISYALSANGQILAPVPGYSWTWGWTIVDASAISIVPSVFSTNGDSQLVQVNDGITDKATKLNVEISIVSGGFSDAGNGEIGTSDIQVFICENPWPPITSTNGTWSPWIDTNTNCLPGTGSCYDTNYLLYYCRDRGDIGSQDDLPAIFSKAVTRGANPDVLKESFFFREETPEIEGVSFSGSPAVEGSSAEFDWQEIIDPLGNEEVDRYEVYYGTAGDSKFIDFASVPAEDAPYVSGNSLFRLEGLENNTVYYFAIKAVYENGSASEYSNEVTFKVDDITPPSAPENVAAYIKNNVIDVSWEGTDPDTVGYIIRYGHTHANPGRRIPENKNELIAGTSKSFNVSNEQGMYFIVVTAVDEYGNESNQSEEIIVIATIANASSGGQAVPATNGYFRNALTNIDFETGNIGAVPNSWYSYNQSQASIRVSGNASFSGDQSLRVYQTPGVPYPGVCGLELVNREAPAYNAFPSSFNWINNTCDFPDQYNSFGQPTHCGGDCIVPEGAPLPWPYSNRTMWASVAYNVSSLKWSPGEEYLMAFYYKGELASSIPFRLGFDMDWLSYCTGLDQGGNCLYGGSWQPCADNDQHCCIHVPYQTDCFDYLNLTSIPAGTHEGDYRGWNLYLATFTYTPELANLINISGNLQNEIGFSIGYNDTGDGTDFYIDDFIVAEKMQ